MICTVDSFSSMSKFKCKCLKIKFLCAITTPSGIQSGIQSKRSPSSPSVSLLLLLLVGWSLRARMFTAAAVHHTFTPSFISSQRQVISGTIPPLQSLKIPSPTRPFNKSAGSFAPPCCNNFVLKAVPVANDSGSS